MNFFYVFCLTFFFSGTLIADPSYSLADVLSLTLLNNPTLQTFSYDMRAGDAKTLQAGFFPNPILDVETENIDAPEFRQTTFLFSQLIELGGKRAARIQLAVTERDLISLDYEVQKREIFVETALLFIEVLTNQQKLTFLEENLKVLQSFLEVVEKRFKAGKASVIEESNFAVLLNTALIDLKRQESELKISKDKLAAKWGNQCHNAYTVVGLLDFFPELIPLEEMGNLIQEHPEVLRLQFEENVRRARVDLQTSEAYPDVAVRGGPRYLEEAKRWVWVVGFTVPLPINDRNQGRILESKTLLNKLEKEKETIWLRLLTELNEAYTTIQTTMIELNLLKKFVLPAAKKAVDFSHKGYQLARYNYLEFLETEKNYRASKIRYLETLGQYHKAFTVLQGLTGSKAAINTCE